MSGQPVTSPEAGSFAEAAAILAERDPVLRRLIAEAGPSSWGPLRVASGLAGPRDRLPAAGRPGGGRIHGRLLAALGGAVTRKGCCR